MIEVQHAGDAGIVITDPEDDAAMAYVGNNADDAWPSNSVYDASGSNFRRIKMCATFVDKLQSLNDPRLDLWAKKVEIPLFISAFLQFRQSIA